MLSATVTLTGLPAAHPVNLASSAWAALTAPAANDAKTASFLNIEHPLVTLPRFCELPQAAPIPELQGFGGDAPSRVVSST